MKVFLINLDRDKERLASASAQLAKFGIAFERVSAVYGKDLTEEGRKKSYNPFRWWCAIGRPIRAGEIGCALSHYGVFRRMTEEDIPYALILEDDVVLRDGFAERLREIEEFVDAECPQVVLLSNHTGGRESERNGIHRSHGDRHAESYVLTQTAAQALLKANYPMQAPCDYWDRWTRWGVIDLYRAYPEVCYPDEKSFGSNTSPNGEFKVCELPLPLYVIHKVKRTVGLGFDRLLEKFRKG